MITDFSPESLGLILDFLLLEMGFDFAQPDILRTAL